MRPSAVVLLFLLTLYTTLAFEECSALEQQSSGPSCDNPECQKHQRHRHKFVYPKGLFVQEKKSAALSAPGQHPNFGAKQPWLEVLTHVTGGRRKMLYLIRHGEAVSNAVQAYVGEKAWKSVSAECSWKNQSSGETLQLFDPSLTARGQNQAAALAQLLVDGNVTFADLTGGRPYQIIVSPLSRTLETYLAVLGGRGGPSGAVVDEFCRERFGHNTCDARRPAAVHGSDTPPAPSPHGPALAAGQDAGDLSALAPAGAAEVEASRHLLGKKDKAAGEHGAKGNMRVPWLQKHGKHRIHCPVGTPLAEKYPELHFPVAEQDSGALGLISNKDTWWRDNERESEKATKQRAHAFLERVFDQVQADIVFVVTHSGFLAAALKAAGREGYSATNAELVPALVEAVRLHCEPGQPDHLCSEPTSD